MSSSSSSSSSSPHAPAALPAMPSIEQQLTAVVRKLENIENKLDGAEKLRDELRAKNDPGWQYYDGEVKSLRSEAESLRSIQQTLLTTQQKLLDRMESLSEAPAAKRLRVEGSAIHDEFVAFWQNLRDAEITTPLGATGQLFRLPNNASILGIRALGSSIYSRPCYEKMYGKIMERLSKAHRKGIVVTGTPGIGKSIFACYLMYRISLDYPKAKIVYADFKRLGRKFFVLSPLDASSGASSSVESSNEEFEDEMACPDNFAIYDMGGETSPSMPVNGISAQTIVLSSANPRHFKHFLREHHLQLVMPSWSEREIDEARLHLYTAGQFNDYRACFRDFGGVPRWVFDLNATHDTLVQEFRHSLPSPEDIDRLLRLQDLTQIEVSKGARLVTYEVNDEYQVTRVRWVSDLVGQWAMEVLRRHNVNRTLDLLRELSETPTAGGAFEIAFEAWAHLKLAAGGEFAVRSLPMGRTERRSGERRRAASPVSQITLQPSKETKYFDKFEEVKDSEYGRPISRTMESIDAIYKPNYIFQMTVSESKNVFIKGLEECIEGMCSSKSDDAPAAYTFVVVVPSMRFHSFSTVKLVSSSTAGSNPRGSPEPSSNSTARSSPPSSPRSDTPAWPPSIERILVLSIPIGVGSSQASSNTSS